MAPFDEIKYESPKKFKRIVGISVKKFEEIVTNVSLYITASKKAVPVKRRGKKSEMSLEDKVLLNFYYRRHYPTFDNLGRIFGISESYANKIYHRMEDILVNVLNMPNPKELMCNDIKSVAIDVTEQPIERPKKGQKAFYSGKKKRHTIKIQLIVCILTLRILCVVCRKGITHDFRILKESKIAIHPDIKKLGDSGYQGINDIYPNSHIPVKKSKTKPLTKEDKKHNRELARQRIKAEHANRYCKIFRITKDTYRGKHKNYGKTWNITAALVNFKYAP